VGLCSPVLSEGIGAGILFSYTSKWEFICYEVSSFKKAKGRYHSADLGIDGRMILERILGKWHGKVWTGFNWLRIENSGGLL
jgi:hypothetical protein